MPETRITAGDFRGRLVETPRGTALRPTRSMIRQALFNVLGERVVDARVVDMFAGAGTVGFEALSRGARAVVFVESDRGAGSLITSNARRFGCLERCRLIHADAARWLRTEPAEVPAADICYVDAPYRDPDIDTILELLGDRPPRLVVCEHHRARRLPERIGKLERVREITHGLSTLTFLQRTNDRHEQ